MRYPKFFDKIETIKLYDPLAEFLGAFEDGLIEYSYLDVVKSAGHSCPTVAGAYIMALIGLKELYENELPVRGEIAVSFKEGCTDGVAGVIGNVITQITGATESTGFKGISGKFKRYGLMKFNDQISSNVKFQRLDSGQSVEVVYSPNTIEASSMMATLMQKTLSNGASKEEIETFKLLWQQRVENIFNNIDKVTQIV